jgi:SAM-dependent methyltransferase
VTPATHALVLSRRFEGHADLRDIFGWTREFSAEDLEPGLLDLLGSANALEEKNGKLRSKVRVSSLGKDLLLHSSFPTDAPDAVFFGPDTYRFASFIEQQLSRNPAGNWLVDMGAGSGAGAVAAARHRSFERITLVDLNADALELAVTNAAAAEITVVTLLSSEVPKGPDLIIANPPYMMDVANRTYRDGGGLLGGALALEWVQQALGKLAPGGTMLLYTGAPYVDGAAPLLSAIEQDCSKAAATVSTTEIDPDVFGEELQQLCYAEVERIAAVGVSITAGR